MLVALAAMVNVFSFGLVYLLAWVAAWVLGRFVPMPAWLQPGLPWLLFNIYLVAGLFVIGELPGAPRATAKLLAVVAVASLALGLLATLWSKGPRGLTIGAWAIAGIAPWLVAALTEWFA